MLNLNTSGGSMATPAHRAMAHNMLMAAGCLKAPSKSLFERLFLQGEKESDVAHELQVSIEELHVQKANLLRTLMASTSS